MDPNERSKQLKAEGCTCDLETSFSEVQDGPNGEWSVFDAEGIAVAECREERYALLISWALNRLSKRYTVCRLHNDGLYLFGDSTDE